MELTPALILNLVLLIVPPVALPHGGSMETLPGRNFTV